MSPQRRPLLLAEAARPVIRPVRTVAGAPRRTSGCPRRGRGPAGRCPRRVSPAFARVRVPARRATGAAWAALRLHPPRAQHRVASPAVCCFWPLVRSSARRAGMSSASALRDTSALSARPRQVGLGQLRAAVGAPPAECASRFERRLLSVRTRIGGSGECLSATAITPSRPATFCAASGRAARPEQPLRARRVAEPSPGIVSPMRGQRCRTRRILSRCSEVEPGREGRRTDSGRPRELDVRGLHASRG
jgi:hypothetical protein